jgi:hypothetical protein
MADTNIDQFMKASYDLISKWDDKKQDLLGKLMAIFEEEVVSSIPVDNSDFEDTFFADIQIGGAEDYANYPFNIGYKANEEQEQHRRFLPWKYLSAGGKKNPKVGKDLIKDSNKGIFLSGKYVQSEQFLESGLTASKSRLDKAIESFMDQNRG